MKLNELRKFIRLILEEEELLGEPDLSSEEEREDDDDEEKLDDKSKNEQNTVTSGNIAGVITPLGTGPAYPADSPKQKRRKKKEKEDKVIDE